MSALEELLYDVVLKHYVPIADPKGCDGAQLLDGDWVMPQSGCDTLQNMLDDMKEAIAMKRTKPKKGRPLLGDERLNGKAENWIVNLRLFGEDPNKMTNKELKKYRGIGNKTVKVIRAILAKGRPYCPHCGLILEPSPNS